MLNVLRANGIVVTSSKNIFLTHENIAQWRWHFRYTKRPGRMFRFRLGIFLTVVKFVVSWPGRVASFESVYCPQRKWRGSAYQTFTKIPWQQSQAQMYETVNSWPQPVFVRSWILQKRVVGWVFYKVRTFEIENAVKVHFWTSDLQSVCFTPSRMNSWTKARLASGTSHKVTRVSCFDAFKKWSGPISHKNCNNEAKDRFYLSGK